MKESKLLFKHQQNQAMNSISKEKLYEAYLSKVKETDEISFKLMGMVPLVSGAGVVTFLTKDSILTITNVSQSSLLLFWVIGIFGALITFFIYMWERRNIMSCETFRKKIEVLESELPDGLHLSAYKIIGDKNKRPKWLGLIPFGKSLAECFIYSTCICLWILLPVIKTWFMFN